ncbi:MAG TPA: hypothetical protein VG405_02365 [Solirubrobacteraceae bacterium]|nr:hypothetical protein [Solirubrobacteraceae bacterium]
MTLIASAPALPLHTAGPYVAAAYIVFLAVILIYVAIMAQRLVRNQRELAQLRRELEERDRTAGGAVPAGSAESSEREVTHQL